MSILSLGTSTLLVAGMLTIPASGATSPSLQFVPVAPCRIMDTRGANGPLGGPFLAGGSTRNVPIPSSSCSVPIASAYALNMTVVPRTKTLGFLTVWPSGQAQPLVSTLNSLDGSILANAAIVPADANGSISVFVTDDTDLVIDINGYFIPPGTSSLQFYPLRPCRVLDTRGAVDPFGGPALAGGTSRSFAIPSSGCGAPTGASAYSFNVAVVPHGSLGFLTVWPTGQAQPLAATLNSLDGSILANAAIVQAGTGGAVSFFATDTTDLVVDINGYFAPPNTGGLNFHTVTPCRVVDTRNAMGPLGGPFLTSNTARTFPLPTSACGLPATAAAYSLNIAVVPQGPLGFLTTWPTGQAQPLVSTLNALKGLVIANAALVPSGSNGAVDVFVTDTTDVVIDTNGFFGQLTADVTATFTAATTQMTVSDTTNIAVGDIVTGRPITINNVLVAAKVTNINVPNTAPLAVGELVSGVDSATGTQLVPAGTVITSIMKFDANTDTITLSAMTLNQSAQASLTFNAAPLFPQNTIVLNTATATGVVSLSQAVTGTTFPGSPGVGVRFTEPVTQERIATFAAGATQITVDSIINVAVGDLVTGVPATVNNVIVSAGSLSINVPNTTQAAVGEAVTGIDPGTGATVFGPITKVMSITAFNATSNVIQLSKAALSGSAQGSVTFDPSPLIPAGTTVVNPPPSSSRVVTLSAATTGSSGPAIVSPVTGSPGVTLKFTQQ